MKIPNIINDIADKKRDETYVPDEESVEDLQRGMKFYADMLNRLFFCIIIAVIFIVFCCTFVRAWIQYF